MNTRNLEKLIEILDKVEPSMFSMGAVRNSTRQCVMGHLLKSRFPDTNTSALTIDEMLKYTEEFTGLKQGSNEFGYLFSGFWRDSKTNTVDHAIYRINSLLEDYKPEHITAEVQKELTSI